MAKVILDVQNISCGYGTHTILKSLSFRVNEGELVGIIGPNGSGKTTLIRAVSKILPLRKEGRIKFNDRDIYKMRHRELAREIAVVSQITERLPFRITVEESVLLGRIPHFNTFQWVEREEDREVVEESMRLVDIIDFRDREIDRLSGGETQRVFIARALAQRPKLLLLDEPTAHLDITHQVRILDLIRRLNREFGLTVIMVLHDLNLASEYCHRLVLLNEGRVCKIGRPEEVMDYKTIEKVYKTVVVIQENPVSSKPHIFVVSEEEGKVKRESG